ncbi:MAG: ABC transporter permease [Haloferacaceae archaeon]
MTETQRVESESSLEMRVVATLRRFSTRAAGFLLGAVALGAWAWYDAVVNEGFTLGTWLAGPLDWVFLLSVLALVWFFALPLALNPHLRTEYWEGLTRTPETTFALAVTVLFFLVGGLGPFIVGRPGLNMYYQYQPPVWGQIDATGLVRCAGPVTDGYCHGSMRFPLGTDRTGRDVLKLLVAGTRVSLYVATISSMLITPIAIAVGTAAGYFGGWVDALLMRYVEVQETVPALVVYMLVVFFTGESLALIILLFGFLSWGGAARIVRSEVLQRREEEYVEASIGLGADDGHLIRRHILPGASNTIVAVLAQQIPMLLLTEAGLAFLGFEDVDVQSLGAVVARGLAQESYNAPPFTEKYWVATFAAVLLAVYVLSFKLLGDALRDVSDPRVD